VKRKEKVTPPSKQDTLVPKEKSIEDLNKEYLESLGNTSSLKRQLLIEQKYQKSLTAASQDLCIDQELLHQTYKSRKSELTRKFNASKNGFSLGLFSTFAITNGAAFLSSMYMMMLGKEEIAAGSLAFNGFFALIHGFFAYDTLKDRKSAIKSIESSVTEYQKRLEYSSPKNC
jgi:hypothetical protein